MIMDEIKSEGTSKISHSSGREVRLRFDQNVILLNFILPCYNHENPCNRSRITWFDGLIRYKNKISNKKKNNNNTIRK